MASPYWRGHDNNTVLFWSSAVLDPRVGHTMDVLSPFISVLCHSAFDFSTASPVHVLMLSIQAVRGLACVHLALFLALSLSPGNSLVSSWCDHSNAGKRYRTTMTTHAIIGELASLTLATIIS